MQCYASQNITDKYNTNYKNNASKPTLSPNLINHLTIFLKLEKHSKAE